MSEQQEKTPQIDSADDQESQDLSVLDEFCKSVRLDDVSLSKWCEHHTSLDLTYYLTIGRDELRETCLKEISMSRTVFTKGPKGRVKTREKIKHQIFLLPDTRDNEKIVIKGGGDVESGRCGDLNVIIKFN